MKITRKATLIGLTAILLVMALAFAIQAAEEDWDAIIAAAQQEGSLTVYNPSSRMGIAAELFEEKYGIKVEWSKMNDVEISDRVAREHEAGVRGADVIITEDAAILMAQLLPQGYVVNYVPPTHKDVIPVEYQNPLVHQHQPRIIGFNNEVYSEAPIKNLWDLTTPEWRGKFMMRDPQLTSTNLAWFAEIIEHADLMAAEYERHFGEPIELTTPNAGWEFVKRLANNRPIMFSSDTDVSDAVGARGQTNPPIGLYVIGKHREIEEKNLALEAAYGLEPTLGYLYPAFLVMTANSHSPNAAKLFISFLLEEEGMSAWAKDMGNFSTNPTIPPHEDDPLGGTAAWAEVTFPLNAQTTIKYYADLFDFWLLHAR
jgi:iron(III) transport system substrate-binding protein